MTTEQPINQQESLLLIQRMIQSAKEQFEDSSFHYLLWGWLVLAACISHFVLLQAGSTYDFIGWMILMPLGGIISAVYGARQGKRQRVKTYTDDIMKYVLISFMVSLGLVLGFMFKLQLSTYPLVMMIYGTWLFVSGGAMKFKPMIIGGIINWVLAVVAFFMTFPVQLILLALAVILGYIIPGYMLKSKHAHSRQQVQGA